MDKIAAAFLLKGRRDGFANLSFPVLPSISPPPFVSLAVWRSDTPKKRKAAFHHQALSLPNINKVYTPDLNVPLLLIVLHCFREKEGRQAVDQHPHEFVFVVWHCERVYKSSDFSLPVSALRPALRRRGPPSLSSSAPGESERPRAVARWNAQA